MDKTVSYCYESILVQFCIYRSDWEIIKLITKNLIIKSLYLVPLKQINILLSISPCQKVNTD